MAKTVGQNWYETLTSAQFDALTSRYNIPLGTKGRAENIIGFIDENKLFEGGPAAGQDTFAEIIKQFDKTIGGLKKRVAGSGFDQLITDQFKGINFFNYGELNKKFKTLEKERREESKQLSELEQATIFSAPLGREGTILGRAPSEVLRMSQAEMDKLQSLQGKLKG